MSFLPHLPLIKTRTNLSPLSELLKRGIWTHSSNWSRCLELPALPVSLPFHLPYQLLLHPYPHPWLQQLPTLLCHPSLCPPILPHSLLLSMPVTRILKPWSTPRDCMGA